MSVNYEKSEGRCDAHQAVLNGDMKAYEQWAKDYDRDASDAGYVGPDSLAKAFQSALSDPNCTLSNNETIRVLDIGSGTGLVAKRTVKLLKSPNQISWTGADISPAMCQEAKKTGLYDKQIEIDLNESDLDEKYDLVVSAGTFVDGHINFNYIVRCVDKNLSAKGYGFDLSQEDLV